MLLRKGMELIERRQEKTVRKGSGDGRLEWIRACSGVAAVQTGERWEQVRVEVRTRLWKEIEIGLGPGGWSKARSHPRTGQDRGEAGRAGSRREGEEQGWE